MDLYLTTDDLNGMRETQLDHMMDVCVIQTETETPNTFNEMIKTWSDGERMACGFDAGAGEERMRSDVTIVRWDAVIRLSEGTVITEMNRIKMLVRTVYDGLEPADVYEIVSPPQRGPTAVRVRVRKVTT